MMLRRRKKRQRTAPKKEEPPVITSYEHMTNKDLREIAESQEIEVNERMTKAELIESLRGE